MQFDARSYYVIEINVSCVLSLATWGAAIDTKQNTMRSMTLEWLQYHCSHIVADDTHNCK